MSRNRRLYVLNKKLMRRITLVEGSKPFCVACGKVFQVGMKVLSKRTNKMVNDPHHFNKNRCAVRRYHEECARKLNIWCS